MKYSGFGQILMGKRIKWLILPLHESEANRHLIGLSGWYSNLLLMHASLANSSKNPTRLNFPVIVATRS
ncbi:MAG TPA: hypothetical protein EYG42_10755 [Porticoccaceae bacterium]|nr:hypothetical protein [Porticoccaceae bacterium]